MKKVGIAFGDFVTEERVSRRRGGGNNFMPNFVQIAPLFVAVIAFSFLSLRLFYLQVIKSEYFKSLSDQNRTRTKIIPAPRGIIVDKNGKPLVANSSAFGVLENAASGKAQKIKRITNDEALLLISEGKKVENDIERDYLYKDAFAHVLGYTGQISQDEILQPEFKDYVISDYVGKIGLEKEYESILHGKNGKELFEVDARGKSVRSLGREAPIDGKNLNSTLDLDVELAAHNAMKDFNKGAVVVSDPRDGSILALYSKPSFDPNIFTHPDSYIPAGEYRYRENILTDTDNQPLLDRSIGGTYPPGSTFKLITAVAALEKGVIRADTQIEDTGSLQVGTFSFGNWYFLQYGRKEGNLDIVGAIKRSNDIFFYKAAEGAGVESIASVAKTFGLGERFGIDLPGESRGSVPTPNWKKEVLAENWYLGDTYNFGIGQGYLLTTPLQVNMWTTVFANGGTLFKPHLLARSPQVVKKDFVKGEYLDLVREGMRQSCDTGGVAWPLFGFKVQNDNLKADGKDYFEDASGSAKMIRVNLACKTGTSQIGGKEDKPHSWITVFAPFYHPEIAVTVLVENGGEGSSIAGPVARDILKAYFEHK